MGAPSVTFTLTNGTTIKASDHNTNFQDLINGITDGTKDLTINSLVAAGGVTCNTLTPTTIAGNPTFSGNVTFSSELKGDRVILFFGNGLGGVGNADAFLGLGGSSTTNEFGYKMHRAGSIVGYSVGGKSTAFTSNVTANLRIRKNAANVISSAALVWTASDQFQHETGTVNRGVNTFSSGDVLSLQWDYTSGNATINIICFVEIQLDT